MTGPATTATRASRRRGAPPSPWGMFLRGFIKHPAMVGAIAPSSNKLINKMLAPVDWAKAKVIVEYGPGVGTFCGPILERMAPDAQLIAIDTNPDFVAYLRDHYRDSRFSTVLGSAADVRAIVAEHGHDHADYALSGLPMSNLPAGVADIIARETQAVLSPGGAFLVYQYHPRVRSFLAPHFADIDHDMEWWNIPPAQLYWAWKA